ncbi:glycosyltransferase [Flavobacterium agrisoli]|uniref:Streptomycin biosynthesis protein StrF domain-containing protein n=1 Tax=Flavobacterium agrisoli TaxID=2793066 RepID=A0A934PN28_9FLAO|nr:glycosyltransferase [Flavobacterium agrisoli]MBK0371247.1 hypothetical protein [Flavobacterium agrisoli]
MISIIICSRTQKVDGNLLINIKNTIGSIYELIIIDNSENRYSIFEAYNLGIDKSIGEYLCFIHDDILFQTQSWGGVLHKIFDENPNIGLIGVAGSKIKTKMPSAWWDTPQDCNSTHIIQHHKNKVKKLHNEGFNFEENVKVVVVDGVFMVLRKDNRIRFSTKLKGFHTYDLNLCFECKKIGYDIIVTNQILLEHFSSGEINEEWVKSSFKLHKIYKNQLPLNIVDRKVSLENEIINAQRFINKSLNLGLKKIAIIIWFKLFLIAPIAKYNLRFWKKIIKDELC